MRNGGHVTGSALQQHAAERVECRVTDGCWQPTQDVVEITIRFLGKSFTVPSHITDRLPKFLNGLQLSTDVGVGGPGGRTVYLVLNRGFVSGTAERMVVSISHAGEITLVPSSP